MKKIIGILLVGLLGFLGCSDGNDGTNTVGEANPVAPFGITDSMTPTYEWTPVPGATRYQLLVEENDVPVIEEWYTTEEVESASEYGLCSVTPETEVTGTTWKVLACAGEECGLWSDELQFSFTVAGSAPRFTDNGDGTVTDNNTKLMWSKNANLSGTMVWQEAGSYCEGLTLAAYSDWRLPSLSESKSLIDTSQRFPALTPGNPFRNVDAVHYWTSTSFAPFINSAWAVNVWRGEGGLFPHNTVFPYCVWPARSGN